MNEAADEARAGPRQPSGVALAAGLAAALAALLYASGCVAEPALPATVDSGESGESVSLRAGAYATTRDGQIQIGFVNTLADSRCPKGAQCIWAGDATARVWLRVGSGPKESAELHTGLGAKQSSARLLGHELRLLRLEPYPVVGRTIAPGDYVATLTLNPGAAAEAER